MNSFESQTLSIECAGEQLLLHPQRVLYWPESKTLFAADVHVGKEHSFGRSGIAIPGGISENNLNTLFKLVDNSGAHRLIVLGDFMHTTPVHSEPWLRSLSEHLEHRPALNMSIVAGNHDKAQGQLLTDSRISWHSESVHEGAFVFQHHPADDSRGYVLSGHLHPAWRLSRSRRGGVRAPVFWFRRHHAVLPAFGSFTGGTAIEPDKQHDKLYLAGNDCVIQVPVTPHRTRLRHQ